jgi:hypothetical protein
MNGIDDLAGRADIFDAAVNDIAQCTTAFIKGMMPHALCLLRLPGKVKLSERIKSSMESSFTVSHLLFIQMGNMKCCR